MMLEYVNHPEETASTRRQHADGLTWIHTGDLGVMDEEGFVYFRQRIKRMIITNGYNVYPSQMEAVIDACDYVQMSCVIGVPDPRQMQKVKAFIVLKPGFVPTEATKKAIMDYCKTHIAKYALPYDIEFRDDLPKTLVGKVAYRKLEEEEAERMSHDAKIQEQVDADAAAAAAKKEEEKKRLQEEQQRKAEENRKKIEEGLNDVGEALKGVFGPKDVGSAEEVPAENNEAEEAAETPEAPATEAEKTE